MPDDRVSVTVRDGIADVRLARPDKLNAIDPAMFDALAGAIGTLAATAGLRAVVLSGEGRGFCAGLDMASMAAGGGGIDLTTRRHGPANRVQHVAWGWRTLPVPVIAAAHGVAYGGGLQVLAGADIRIAHPDARFAVMEAKWGIVPDMAGFVLWRGCVRDDVLRLRACTADPFDAQAALDDGFVTRISDDPHADAMAIARTIAGRSPDAIRAVKRLANLSVDAEAATILAAESTEQAALLKGPNQIEAVRAALASRDPRFAEPD